MYRRKKAPENRENHLFIYSSLSKAAVNRSGLPRVQLHAIIAKKAWQLEPEYSVTLIHQGGAPPLTKADTLLPLPFHPCYDVILCCLICCAPWFIFTSFISFYSNQNVLTTDPYFKVINSLLSGSVTVKSWSTLFKSPFPWTLWIPSLITSKFCILLPSTFSF